MKKIILLLAVGSLLCANGAMAQQNAIKTNFVGWATTSINAAYEMGLAKKTTLEIGASYNPWTFKDNKKIRHWFVQPELRFWNCERFNRGFWGVHLIGGQFNVGGVKLPFGIYPGVEFNRYQGWALGAGVSYGYSWYLSPHLNFEATAGVGYVHANYKQYDCVKCGEKRGKGTKNYFGPTKLALNLVYLF